MRGKRIDSEFLSNFITECISIDKNSPEEIVAEAKLKISNIDNQIKEVEELRSIRSKLLSVIETFDKTKPNKTEEIKILAFFKIHNQKLCHFICHQIKNKNIIINDLCKNIYSKQDILFGIKQLLEQNIIVKSDNFLLKGSMFDSYMKFVLKDGIHE